MSFRHTYVTEFLYKYDKLDEMKAIWNCLDKYGTVNWHGPNDYYGYIHGIIKDLDGHETRKIETKIIKELRDLGCEIKIVFE